MVGTHGKLDRSLTPIIAWKRMWYGKFNLIKHIKESNIKYDSVINMRSDLFRIPS